MTTFVQTHPYSVIYWQRASQSCSLPVLTSLPITQAASQTSDKNSIRLLCERTLINHQLNQTIYCVISRQLVNTSQILLTAVTAFLSLHIPIRFHDHDPSPILYNSNPCKGREIILHNKGRRRKINIQPVHLLNCLLAKTFFSLGIEGQLLTKKRSAITLVYVFYICNVVQESNFFKLLYCTKLSEQSGKQKLRTKIIFKLTNILQV